jgi:hypothetical protein
MNIIKHLQQDKNYVLHASKALLFNFETIDIDCSHGETDRTLLLYIPKNNFSFDEAFAILTMKQKMLSEEWEELDLYDTEDVKMWAQLLAKEYASSTYFENVTIDEFLNDHFVHRLQITDGIIAVFKNDKQMPLIELQKNLPWKNNIIKIAKSTYTRLEVEYYVETDAHFVLVNWYTTA